MTTKKVFWWCPNECGKQVIFIQSKEKGYKCLKCQTYFNRLDKRLQDINGHLFTSIKHRNDSYYYKL